MHRLATSFVLAYHGCDQSVAEKLLQGEPFKPSRNDYDWLGPGAYFWEANPVRGMEYAQELKNSKRKPGISSPTVIGAVVDLGLCLDLTTSAGVQHVSDAYKQLVELHAAAGYELPKNEEPILTRKLDCAVITLLHKVREEEGLAPIDSVRGIFTEGNPIYPTSGFYEKTHVQISVRNLDCIKAVFRVPKGQFS